MVTVASGSGHAQAKRRGKRVLRYTDSQLVISTMEQEGGTTRKLERKARQRTLEAADSDGFIESPMRVTPSPPSERQTSQDTQTKRSTRLLFPSKSSGVQRIPQEETPPDSQWTRTSCRKQLFQDNSKGLIAKTAEAASDTTPRSPHKKSTLLNQPTLVPKSPPKSPRDTRQVASLTRTRKTSRRIAAWKKSGPSASWDSLAAIGPAPKPAPRSTGNHRRRTVSASQKSAKGGKELSKPSDMETMAERKPIPKELVNLLIPKGLTSRKIRTPLEILKEEGERRKQELVPTRQCLVRACKVGNSSLYVEDSDDDEFMLPSDMAVDGDGDRATKRSLVDQTARFIPATILTEPEEEKQSTPVSSLTSGMISISSDTDNRPPTKAPKGRRRLSTVANVPDDNRGEGLRTTRLRKNRDKDGKGLAKKSSSRSKTAMRSEHIAPKRSQKVQKGKQRPAKVSKKVNSPRRERSIRRYAAAAASTSLNSVEDHAAQPKRGTSAGMESTHVPASTQHQLTTTGAMKVKKKGSKTKVKTSKVRFAPLPTTTFSVKIRIKTSPTAASLSSQSVVQSIAKHLTEACLLQAPGTTADATGEPIGKESSAEEEDPPTSHVSRLPSSNQSVASELTLDVVEPPEVSTAPESDELSPVDEDVDSSFVPQSTDDSSSPPPVSRVRRSHSLRRRQKGHNEMTAVLTPSPPKETTSPPSPKRKSRRTMSCSDSLAGNSLASINSFNIVTPRVPREVSVNRESPRLAYRRAAEKAGLARNAEQGVAQVVSPRKERPTKPVRRQIAALENDETVETDKSTESRRTARSLVNGKCGKCSACKLEVDCMMCKKCLLRLQMGKLYPGEETGCLQRVCRAARSQGQVESLGQIKLAPRTQIQPQEAPTAMEKEDVPDHLSDTTSVYSTASKKKRSRALRLWRQRQMQTKANDGAGSVSSISNTLSWMASGTKSTSKRRRKGKSKKNPLHDLEIPIPTDASLASFTEGRKNLRALMHYDEADQDWI